MSPSHSHTWLCPQIYFWEAQRRNVTERVKTLFLAENSVKLKNLTGYTAYMVSVAAFNAAGDGPRSTPTRGQTQQAGEGGRWTPAPVLLGVGEEQRPYLLRYLGWTPRACVVASRRGEHNPKRRAYMRVLRRERLSPKGPGESLQMSPVLPTSCSPPARFCPCLVPT